MSEEEFDWEAYANEDFEIEKASEHSDEEVFNTEALKPQEQIESTVAPKEKNLEKVICPIVLILTSKERRKKDRRIMIRYSRRRQGSLMS